MLLHRPNRFKNGSGCTVNIQSDEAWSPHFHNSYEVCYVLEGALACTVNNKTEIIRQGEFSICLPNEIHEGRCIGHTVFWVCIFSKEMVHSFSKRISGKEGDRFSFTCRDTLRAYLEEAFINAREQDILLQQN